MSLRILSGAVRLSWTLWTGDWRRMVRLRRAMRIAVACLVLAGSTDDPCAQYRYLGTDAYPVAGGGTQYVVRWLTWGRLREAAVWSRTEAAELAALIWSAGR